jgi:hypothetical protein
MCNVLTSATIRPLSRWFKHAVQLLSALTICAFVATTAHADPQRVAFLGIHFQNDNAGYEPTSDAEQNRMKSISKAFEKMLVASGKYTFVSVPASEQQKIKAGQMVGACGGCEYNYGRDLNADLVAWIRVQKVSNLILNINVYMADVSQKRATFIHSIDLRGNTDESWMRGIKYLVQNYLLRAAQG